ncbi:immunoglobulin iota chain [Pimephales promelas]|nr:immunoglobulin iota chain [Pimephales promelas]
MALCYNNLLSLAAFILGCTAQDNVIQSKQVTTAFEDGTATLDCTYKATSTQYPNLFWYQQKTNESPKYMLMRLSGSSNNDEEFKWRFNADLNTSAFTVPLTIKDVSVSDSAVYYCALRPTVRKLKSTHIQKHKSRNMLMDGLVCATVK